MKLLLIKKRKKFLTLEKKEIKNNKFVNFVPILGNEVFI